MKFINSMKVKIVSSNFVKIIELKHNRDLIPIFHLTIKSPIQWQYKEQID